VLTAEDLIKRIAAECVYVDERGRVGYPPETGGRSCAPVWRAIPRDCGTINAAQSATAAGSGAIAPLRHHHG
jgi:hypothetical protein